MSDHRDSPLRWLPGRPRAEEIGETPEAFLRWLGGPTAVVIPGRDRSRCRGLVTLLHGNEPSSLIGLHAWLRQEPTPATDVLVVIASVEAALHPPGFAHRMLPGRRDLNRCFVASSDDIDGRVAAAIVAAIREHRCESVVDVHNNSGHNPPYGVITVIDADRAGLVALFADRCVHTEIALGTLLEATVDLPTVSIECGRSGDPAADAVALAGIVRYTGRERLDDPKPTGTMMIYDRPIRVCVADGVELAFAEERVEGVDVTFTPDVDAHNFGLVPKGTLLGWVRDGAPYPFVATDSDGNDQTGTTFVIEGGELRAAREFVPIMMTTTPRIAKVDCLCYLVSRRRGVLPS